MIDIEENHILGRCLDIDVYTMKENKLRGISRSDLFKSPRRCFICDLDAKICSRAQTHSMEEIKTYFEETYSKYKQQEKKTEKLAYDISQIALKAMISEVSTFPSFGLVSPVTSGSHKDMDYYTFLDSSMAIAPYLKEMFYIGYNYHEEKYIFDAIRDVGKVCEIKMFEVTKNVNTHKGMIFLMGIVMASIGKVIYDKKKFDEITNVIKCEIKMFEVTKNVNTHKGMIFLMGIVMASIGKVIYDKKKFDEITNVIKSMVEDILNDFKDLEKKEKLTHGEKLYLDYGFTGIRGQVKDGLSVLFDNIIDKYMDSKLKGNDLYTQILIELMSKVEDSTIVYRHNIDTLRKVQSDAKHILQLGGIYTLEGKKICDELEKEYIKDNISPGGCADLLAVCILLMDIKKVFKEYNLYIDKTAIS